MPDHKPSAGLSAATLSVWAGEEDSLTQGATQVPVVYSAAYAYPDLDTWLDVALGRRPGHMYSRNTNPTVQAFETKVRLLEGAPAATSFATGMAAISNTLFTLLSPGDRIVSVKDSYGGTNKLFLEFLPRFGVKVDLCDTTDHGRIEASVAAGCKVLYLETPTNPTLKVMDIARLAAAGRRSGAVVVADNTFATPVNQNPLALGADLVVHSATKFLGGHADALGGVACGSKDLIARIYHFREITGATLDPMAAFLLIRGMKTLHLRVRQQNESALTIARWLQGHPSVAAVFYPGLETHPQHDIAQRQMRGFGGVLSFMLKGGFESVRNVLPRLRLVRRAANLGSVETIAGPPATTSHCECTAEEREAMGIPEGLVRYSVGIEDPKDLIADLDQALGPI
ncbi:MAG TPA: cystathionine gamma-synthase family protein [Acidobacteriota bacterium]|nr:cystathionine gamma-synthase family protein [Acidobacteriota bacterium]